MDATRAVVATAVEITGGTSLALALSGMQLAAAFALVLYSP